MFDLIQSPKAKAIVALILTVAIGVLGQVAVATDVFDASQRNTASIILAALTALATTLGVYRQGNTPDGNG